MCELIVKCPAKINLFFNIVGRDYRGYHLVHGLNQSISLYDTLTIRLIDNGINITCDNKDIPTDNRNSVYKAIEYFLEYTKINTGVSVHINKNIPLMSGLGGESTDAAGILVGLNKLLNTNLSLNQLASIGYKVGCDVPFCVYGGSKEVKGCGEVITNYSNRYKHYLIVTPFFGFSTKDAFLKYDNLIQNYKEKEIEIGYNDFHLILDNEIKDLIENFRSDFNCISMLTGSGSSIICIFDNESDLNRSYNSLKSNNFYCLNKVHSCSGILL